MNDRPSIAARPPLTDSPWFWLLLFSLAGLVLLAIISPKYAQRQGKLELQYQAHAERLRRASSTGHDSSESARPMAPTGDGRLIIPLWPLALLLVASCAVSGSLLVRSRRQLRVDPEEKPVGDRT